MARLRFAHAFDIRDLPNTPATVGYGGITFDDGAARLVLGSASEVHFRSKVPGAEVLRTAALSDDGAAVASFTGLDLPGLLVQEKAGAALAHLLLRGDDLILGSRGDDRLFGFSGADTLLGGAGVDVMTGGGGADVFRFTALAHSPASDPDRITDFRPGRDTIDLSGIDAVHGTRGDQDFDFVGTAAFSGAAGELRWNGRALRADVDGDGVADFVLHLGAGARPETGDLLL
jgi:Ca2+-binding RTX toxin-like protein